MARFLSNGLPQPGQRVALAAGWMLSDVGQDVHQSCSAPRVIGIDDFARKSGQRYGTVVSDLGRRCITEVLPDRHRATVEAWLARHPGITVVARDRGAGYGHAVALACPQAIQVADRWHLTENASAAFMEAVRQNFRAIRKALATSTVDPELLTCAQKLRYRGFYATSPIMP